jgi:ABC-2 type transport system ATP-binding protein
VVLEAAGFHPARADRDHLRVGCTACGYPLRRADEVLEICGLAAAGRRKVRGYSSGCAGGWPWRLRCAGILLR